MSSSVAGPESSSLKSPHPAADGTSSDPGRKSPAAPDTGLSPRPLIEKSSSPASARGNGRVAAARGENGTVAAEEDGDAQDESEAETVVLSDRGGSNANKDNERTIKNEKTDGEKMSEIPSPKASPRSRASPNGVKPRRASEAKEDLLANRKSLDRKSENGVSHRNHSSPKPQSPNSPKDSSWKGSPRETPASPRERERERDGSTAPSRKRKNRDDHPLDQMEPPRQRQKSVASARDNTEHPLRKPASSHDGSTRPHQRSASIQSNANNAPGRKRKDLTLDRRQYHSDSDSDTSSSPRPQSHVASKARERVQRSSNRSLASPLRSMAPRKNVDKFGATRLARECEKGDVRSVEEVYLAATEELNQEDYAGNSPLQKAALHGHAEIVQFLIAKGCRTNCESKTGDTPLIDAVENGHLDVVKLLLNKGKVNPHHQNHKGQRAVDVVNDDEDNAEEIEKELQKAMRRENNEDSSTRGSRQPQQSSNLLYNEYNTETLKDKAAEGDMAAVAELITSNIKPNNACGVAAARGGHDEILSIFLGVGLKSDPDPAKHNETPMTVAIGRGHLKVIQMLLDQDGFDPCRRDRQGRTYWELSEERQGPRWQSERDMLKTRFDEFRRQKLHPGEKGSPGTAKKRQANFSPGSSRSERTKARATTPASQKPARDERDSSPMSPDIKKRRRRTSSSASHPAQPPIKKTSSTESKMRSERDRERFKPSTSRPSSKDSVSQRELMRRRRVVDDDDSSDEEASRSPPPLARKSKSIRDEKRDETRKISGTKIKKEDRSTPDSVRKSTPDIDKEREARRAEIRARKEERRAEEERKKKAEQEKEEKRRAEELKKKQAEEERRAAEEKRKAAERQAAEEKEKERRRIEAERKRKAEEAAEAERKRLAEEKAKAEEEAAAAEAARLAKERKEAEEAAARKKAEEAAAAARKAERERLISALPTQLRLAVTRPADRPLTYEAIGRRRRLGIEHVFMPIHTVAFSELDPTTPLYKASPGLSTASANGNQSELLEAAKAEDAKPEPERLWMLSHQAIGVLGLTDFDAGLEGWPNLSASPSEWRRLPVTPDQLGNWMEPYDAYSLAFEYHCQYEPLPADTTERSNQLMENWRKGQEGKESLFKLREKLRWVPYADFLREAAKRPELAGLNIWRTGVSHAMPLPATG